MTKEKLKEYIRIKEEAEQLRDLVLTTREQMLSIGAVVIDDLPKPTTKSDKIATIIANYQELCQKYWVKQIQCIKQLVEIDKGLERLSPLERTLMRKRYIEGKGWELISKEMHYSCPHVKRLHSIVLRKIKQDDTQ